MRLGTARGLHVTLATGRMPPGSRRYWEELGITAPVILTIAVGDQENDLEMIRAAGVGVAMPHAPERVRAVADRIAPAPEAGGLLALFAELSPEHFA